MEAGAPERRVGFLTRYENYQIKWMEDMRGNLMLVSTVIATMTFQIAINPPGGVLQENKSCSIHHNNQSTCTTGTSVFVHDDHQTENLHVFLIMCTISFSASLTIIILLISGFPLRNRVTLWTLIIAMSISVYCTVAAYLLSIRMVMDPLDKTVKNIIRVCALYWIGLGGVIFLIRLIRFLFWLVKMLVIALCKGICCFVGLIGKLCKCEGQRNRPADDGIRAPEISSQV